MSEHTNGRMSWVRRRDGSLFYVIGDPKNGPHAQGDIYIGEDDLRRMTAAWNACEGIDTYQIERFGAGVVDTAVFYRDLSNDLLAALKEAREALQFANDTPGGPINDTIWMMHRPETLFDFMDVAIAKAEAGKVGDEG